MPTLNEIAGDGPWSEKYRLAAHRWVEADKAARLLEDCKSAVFAEMKTRIIREANESMSETKAERLTRADPGWRVHVREICEARTEANRAKVEMEFIRMRAMEWQAMNANRRAEMRL